MALQLAVVRQSEFLIARLTFGIAFPSRGGAFVAADMDGLVGEDVHQFAEDVLGKLHRLGIGHVENVARDTARGPDGVRAVGVATELRIGSHGRNEVARHINLGDNLDVTLLGIGHHVAQFVLRVEVGAVGLVEPVLRAGVHVGKHDIGRNAADRGQFGVFLDFHAPSLVVAEVPVEAVHLIIGHNIEHALHLINGEEVAAHVKHKTAIAKARRIVDADQRKGILGDSRIGLASHDVGGQQLLDGLEGIVKARGGAGFDADAFGRDIHLIAFLAQTADGQVNGEECAFGANGGRSTRGGIVTGDKLLHFPRHFLGKILRADDKTIGEHEFARRLCHRFGARRQVDEILCRDGRQRHAKQH